MPWLIYLKRSTACFSIHAAQHTRMTLEKQVIPAENLTRNTETPVGSVLFGSTGRVSETRNWAKPGIIQTMSFKCRRWYGRCACWETDLKDTCKSGIGWDTGKDICQGRQKGWDKISICCAWKKHLKNKHPVQLLTSATLRHDKYCQYTTETTVTSAFWLPSRKYKHLCSHAGSVLWQHRLLRSLFFFVSREDSAKP